MPRKPFELLKSHGSKAGELDWVPLDEANAAIAQDLAEHEAWKKSHAELHKGPWCDPEVKLDALKTQLEKAELILKKITDLKPRWDDHGEFYKPENVLPIRMEARAYFEEKKK